MFRFRPPSIPTLAALLTAVLAAAPRPASAQLMSVQVVSGLDRPVRLVAPPGDARLFVVERPGVILVFDRSGAFRDTLLDIRGQTTTDSERGLLGLAFPPDHAATGRFYINHTDLSGNTRIERYTVGLDPDRADPATLQPVLEVDQPYDNHNGGNLEFAPDGMLYIGLGDGGSSGDPENRAQDDQQLLGKMLRLDVSGPGPGYAIPPDNPFVGSAPLDEIWAKGVRNPWCFSFDRATGDLYIADVGQSLREEIDVQPAASGGGENYGWHIMEGTLCYDPPSDCPTAGLTLPVYEYGHGGTTHRCAISGGVVYRGAAIPQARGRYFFADYCSNEILSITWTPSAGVTDTIDWTAEVTPPGGFGHIVSFGEDGDGEVYVVDHGAGAIYRLAPSPDAVADLPRRGLLEQNVPNPFNPRTTIAYRVLPGGAPAALRVYDAAGRLVRTLVEGVREPGRHTVEWDGTDARGRRTAAGVYVYRIVQGGAEESMSMVLLE